MNLREQLKTKTMTFHKAAELASARYAPIDKLHGYYFFLCGMYNMYTKYASALDKGSVKMSLPPRSQKIIKALETDIINSPKHSYLPEKSNSLPIKCDQSLLGISYVFEGSALGSNVLIRRIPIKAKNNYLTLLIKDTPLRWPQTIKFLSNTDYKNKSAIDEACNVFKDIAQTMKDVSIGLK